MTFLIFYILGAFITLYVFKKKGFPNPHKDDEQPAFVFGLLLWPATLILNLIFLVGKGIIKLYDKL